MKKFCLPLVLLSLLSGTAYAGHPPPLPLPLFRCTDGEFFISVVATHDPAHHGGFFLVGLVNFDDGDFVETIAWVDGLVLIDAGPNLIWRGDGFHLRTYLSRTSGGTSLVSAKFNGRDDDGNPILTGNLVCTLFVR